MSVTLSVDSSKITGPAPLGVFFDATGTTSTTDGEERIHADVQFFWTLNVDPDQVNLRGPLQAYEFPWGTHSVTVTAVDSAGATDTETITITVTDPDDVYAGADTICVSSSGQFGGAPPGAAMVTLDDSTVAINANLANGKRVLFRRGDEFETASEPSIAISTGPAEIGAFGSGDRPLIKYTNQRGSPFRLGACTDLTIQGLKIQRTGQMYAPREEPRGVWSQALQTRTNVHDCEIIDFPTQYDMTHFWDGGGATGPHVGTILSNTTTSNPYGHGHKLGGKRQAIIDCNLTSGTDSESESLIRVYYADRVLIGDNVLNYITGSNANDAVCKFHNAVSRSWSGGYEDYAQYICFVGNDVSAGPCNWPIPAAPQNSSSDEWLRRCLFERNRFVLDRTSIVFQLSGEDMTVRNNKIYDPGTSTANFTLANIDALGITTQTPIRNEVHHNTYYGTASRNNVRMSAVSTSHSGNALIQNNLAHHATATITWNAGAGGSTETGNWKTSDGDPLFVDQANGDLHLTDSSPVIDQGATLAAPIQYDLERLPRPQGAGPDPGAYESTEVLFLFPPVEYP